MKLPEQKTQKTYGSNFQQQSSVPSGVLRSGYGSDFKTVNKGLDYSRPAGSTTSRSSTRAPVRSTSSSRSSSRGSSGGSRSSGGGGGGGGITTPALPKVPSAADYLGKDTTYQSQIAQMRKAYADFLSSQNNDKTQYQNQYGLNVKSLGESRTQGFDDLLNDYAGRGLLNSGVYGKAYSDLETDFNGRQTQLDTQRQAYLQDLATNLGNFQGDQATATTSAKQEALARRAAQYGG